MPAAARALARVQLILSTRPLSRLVYCPASHAKPAGHRPRRAEQQRRRDAFGHHRRGRRRPTSRDLAASGSAFDVCRGALALRTLLAVNGAVLLSVLVSAGTAEQALAGLGPAVDSGAHGHRRLAGPGVRAARGRCVRLAPLPRGAVLVALGAVLAPLACVPMFWLELLEPRPLRLLALPLIGAALAAAMALWLQWREGRRTRPMPARGWPNCSRAFARIFCSTPSTPQSLWCVSTRDAPRACSRTWPNCSALRSPTTGVAVVP